MIKAKNISAISIDLTNDISATLLQVGEKWNGLTKWVCVPPGAFVDQHVITAPVNGELSFAAVFGDIFSRTQELMIVMATPEIGAAIKVASECKAAGA